QIGEIELQLMEIRQEILRLQSDLKALIFSDSAFLASEKKLSRLSIESRMDENGFRLSLPAQRQQVRIAEAEYRLAKTGWYPELSGRFVTQKWYQQENPYSGFSVTLGFPILGAQAQRNKVKAAFLERNYQETLLAAQQKQLETGQELFLEMIQNAASRLDYYE